MSFSFSLLGKIFLLSSAAALFFSMPVAAHKSNVGVKPVASRITIDNVATHSVGGMDSQGGLGDWFLSNGVLCAIVSDPSQESSITRQGGFLTDLGFCGKEDDHFLSMYPTLYMNLDKVMEFQTVNAELIDGTARIQTLGRQNGLAVSVTYSASVDAPNILDIATEISRVSIGEPMERYGEVILTAHSMPFYSVSISRDVKSSGFSHIENQPGAADLTVLLGSGDPGHNIMYGYHHIGAELIRLQQEPVALRSFDMSGTEFTARFAVLSDDLKVGDKLRFHQEIILAPGLAVSPITDQLWKGGFDVNGTVGEAGVTLLVEEPSGGAVTHAITKVDGAFKFRVPNVGEYKLKVRAKGREERLVSFTVTEQGSDLAPLTLSPPATLILPENQIMRLSFTGLEGTRDPNFTDTHIDHQIMKGQQWVKDRSSRFAFLSGDASDVKSMMLAPGKYLVTASRGPEYTAHQTTINLVSGQQQTLSIETPRHIVATPGYMSADFHVHSGRSFDNNLGTVPRLKSYVAQGAEILIATEHDTIYEFTDLIESMGLATKLKTVTGTELTSELGNPSAPYGLGHANVFPLKVLSMQPRRGAPKHENHRWRDVIAGLGKKGDRPLVQLNHPLADSLGDVSAGLYFSHMSVAGKAYDPHIALTEAPNNVMIEPDIQTGVRDIDFDIIEVENGNVWGERYIATRDAWFSLLRQGIQLVAAANSDSHGVGDNELAANVRNMVFTGAEHLADYRESTFLQGIRDGNLYGTNGPLLEVSLNGAVMGGLATPLAVSNTGKSVSQTSELHNAIFSLQVSAAQWLKVESYKLYVNGELVTAGGFTVGKKIDIPLMISEDAFVTIEATGPITELSREVIGNVAPFAFSNPIFFDANSDGKWTSIGTPLPK